MDGKGENEKGRITAMGEVLAEITLKNGADIIRRKDGNISDKDVRSLTVTALVDTGAHGDEMIGRIL